MTESASESSLDRAYFRAIEDLFIRLRGTPFLLSPADWRVAESWRTEGIPLNLVQATIRELFEERTAATGNPKPISSLRYCDNAVNQAWKELQDLSPISAPSASIDVAFRLASLSAALPSDLPDRDAWTDRLAGLTGEAEQVERQLAELDDELLTVLVASLEDEERRALEDRVEEALDRVGPRVAPEAMETTRTRLRHQEVRRVAKAPVLSIFAPEAEAS